jgi:hypothetical protein
MRGAIVLPFPEMPVKPQGDVIEAMMAILEKDDCCHFAAAKAMFNAIENNQGKEPTRKRMQLIVNCLWVAYLSLGRLIGEGCNEETPAAG